MSENRNFLLNISVLYRNIQKYFDHVLAPYEIGSGQVIILMVINENTGITMQEVSSVCEIDKGTCTKSVNRLIEQGYVQVRVDEKDRRIRRLYTTDKASDLMSQLYEYRNVCRQDLATESDFQVFENQLDIICDNSRKHLNATKQISHIKIGSFKRLSLNDYPGVIGSTVETAGCCWKCPYCNRRNLIYIPEDTKFTNPEEVLDYLQKRKNVLDGVTITGGEPLIQSDLKPFLENIRAEGYRIHLCTAGNRPELLREYCDEGLIDLVSMDIKNCRERYAETAGMEETTFSLTGVEKSVAYLKESSIPHEFVTTVVKELTGKDELLKIAEWIGPSQHYILQQFRSGDTLSRKELTPYGKEEIQEILTEIRKTVPDTELRGFEED